jgi:hypothetical protein
MVNGSEKMKYAAYLRNAIGKRPEIDSGTTKPLYSSSSSLQMASQPNGTSADWPGRYYHIDQVLNTPGPRTDPAFLAGDGVRD